MEEVKDGKVIVEGVNDVLTKVLGKPEHGGRVRGQGKHVRQSDYFHLPRQKKAKTMDEKISERVQKFMAEETPKIISERDAFWAAEIEKLKAELFKKSGQHDTSPNPISHQASCSQSKGGPGKDLDKSQTARKISVEDDRVVYEEKVCEKVDNVLDVLECDNKVVGEEDNVKEIKMKKPEEVNVVEEVKVLATGSSVCQLAVGDVSNIVAYAKVDEVPVVEGHEQTIHGVKVVKENARVSITKVIQTDAKIPFPIGEEIVTVGQALGTFVAWPRDLIVAGNTSTSHVLAVSKVRMSYLVKVYIQAVIFFFDVHFLCFLFREERNVIPRN